MSEATFSGKKNVSFITVGHSPREDIMVDLSAHLSKDIIVRQVGVLDAYTVDQVHDEFAPLGNEPTMVSRLRNGEMCSFQRRKSCRSYS